MIVELEAIWYFEMRNDFNPPLLIVRRLLALAFLGPALVLRVIGTALWSDLESARDIWNEGM